MSFTLLGPLVEGGVPIPLCLFKIPAGFQSPAADHIEQAISLDEVLNVRAPHVYLASIDGDSMKGIGIYSGDLAVIDRSGFRADRLQQLLCQLRAGVQAGFGQSPHRGAQQ